MPRLRIVSVNDVYTLENLPRLATLVKAQREVNPADAFLAILAGDFLAPSMLSSLDFGAGMVDCLNQVGITHVIFGNHEDDVPLAELDKRIGELGAVWLDTNAHAFGGRLPRTQVIDVGGVRVGLLGVVMNDPSTYRDVPFGSAGVEPANEVAVREAGALLQACDCVIPLTHQPISDDRALARSSPSFPLIIGGHEHVPFLEQVGSTWIVKAGADAEKAVIVDLVWSADAAALSPVVTVRLEPVAGYAEDAFLRARVDRHMIRVRELEAATLLAIADGETLSSVGTRREQTTLGTLVCSRIRDTLGAEVALMNGGGIRGCREYRTHFTYGDLKAELPFDNELVVVRLPGAVLADAIASSRAAPESGSYLQVDDGVVVDPRIDGSRGVTHAAGGPLDPCRFYAVALVRNLFAGLDHIEPLVRYGRGHPGCVPDAGAGRDAKHVLVEAFTLDLWRRLPEFAVVDANHDGVVSGEEMEQAIADALHEAPSPVVAGLVMSTLDSNQDHLLSREESAAIVRRPK